MIFKQLQTVLVNAGIDAFTGGHDLGADSIMAPQIYYTAGLTGSFKLQGCNDNASWEDVPNSSYAVSGSAGHQMWNIQKVGFIYARVYFVYTSGSGSWGTRFSSKGSS